MKKDVKQVVKIAEGYGFTCMGLNGKSHWTLQHSSGARITIASSPSRGRWRENALAQIRRIHTAHTKDTP